MAVEITQELVKEIFDYKDGFLLWKKKTAICVKIGTYAGSKRADGRRVVRVKKRHYYENVIIFLWHHGYMPERVDHEDRDHGNSRIENLRAATIRQNNCNRSSAKGSSSIYLGVHKRRNKWQSAIRVNKKPIYIGIFENQESAALSYNREAVRYHGEFANLNIIKPCLI